MDGMTDTPTTPTTMTGDQFAQALDDLGWQQTEFARRTGTSPDTINRWCNGRQPIPAWAVAHVELLLAGREFFANHVAPWPRTRRPAGDQGKEGQA